PQKLPPAAIERVLSEAAQPAVAVFDRLLPGDGLGIEELCAIQQPGKLWMDLVLERGLDLVAELVPIHEVEEVRGGLPVLDAHGCVELLGDLPHRHVTA